MLDDLRENTGELSDKNICCAARGEDPHRPDYTDSWNLQWPSVLVGPSEVRSHSGDRNMNKLAYVVLIVIGKKENARR
jgi:hypothetical protein